MWKQSTIPRRELEFEKIKALESRKETKESKNLKNERELERKKGE